MWCALSRWMISRTADTGRKPPRLVERHIGRCCACGEYARFASTLKARLAGDRAAFLAEVPGPPLNEPAWAAPGTAMGKPASFGRRLALRPLPAAAAVLAVVAAALLIFRVALREPGPTSEDRAAGRAAIMSIAAAPGGFRGALTEAESSLERERQALERSVASAVEYLQARLNVRIERRDPPQDL